MDRVSPLLKLFNDCVLSINPTQAVLLPVSAAATVEAKLFCHRALAPVVPYTRNAFPLLLTRSGSLLSSRVQLKLPKEAPRLLQIPAAYRFPSQYPPPFIIILCSHCFLAVFFQVGLDLHGGKDHNTFIYHWIFGVSELLSFKRCLQNEQMSPRRWEPMTILAIT